VIVLAVARYPIASSSCFLYAWREAGAINLKHYQVSMVPDEPVRLRDRLDELASENSKIISIIWQPTRQIRVDHDATPYEALSGYVIISEHEFSDASRT
jgi:hypothetical protein